VHGTDGGLQLIRTGLVAAKAPADDRLALPDEGPIPPRAVLFAEHDAGRLQHSREDLDGRGLPRSIGTDVADGLSGLDADVDACDRDDILEARLDEVVKGTTKPGFPRRPPVRPDELTTLDTAERLTSDRPMIV
jgi:hypothetical protein